MTLFVSWGVLLKTQIESLKRDDGLRRETLEFPRNAD